MQDYTSSFHHPKLFHLFIFHSFAFQIMHKKLYRKKLINALKQKPQCTKVRKFRECSGIYSNLNSVPLQAHVTRLSFVAQHGLEKRQKYYICASNVTKRDAVLLYPLVLRTIVLCLWSYKYCTMATATLWPKGEIPSSCRQSRASSHLSYTHKKSSVTTVTWIVAAVALH